MKSKKNIIIVSSIAVLLILVGIALGVFVKNFPCVSYKNEIDLFSALTFLVTLGIGIIFPFLIKKWIDDNQSIKLYLVQEVEMLESILYENMAVIEDCYKTKTVTSDHKDKVNFTFFNADLQIESLQKQFEISFPNNLILIESIKNQNSEYYHFLTGGEFMVSDFQIDSRFYKEHKTKLNRMTMNLKELIHKIHKL
jgi:hypothetical protein